MLFVCESALKRSDFLIKYNVNLTMKLSKKFIIMRFLSTICHYKKRLQVRVRYSQKKPPQVLLILSPQLASTGQRGHKSFFPNIYILQINALNFIDCYQLQSLSQNHHSTIVQYIIYLVQNVQHNNTQLIIIITINVYIKQKFTCGVFSDLSDFVFLIARIELDFAKMFDIKTRNCRLCPLSQ